jgi:hypothetical protein
MPAALKANGGLRSYVYPTLLHFHLWLVQQGLCARVLAGTDQ